MEGPSLVILTETLRSFTGKTISEAHGNAKIDYGRLKHARIKAFRSWGKHFLIVFKDFSVRIHFLMFGSYRVNERKDAAPRLSLHFENGDEINFYTTAVRIVDGDINDHYDWTEDVLHPSWDAAKARRKLKKDPTRNVGDALLDQHIFSGVGNIIKNEVLFRIRVHPNSNVGALPPRKLSELIYEARNYSYDFYHWKKKYELRKNYQIFTKKTCPRCKLPVVKEHTGKTPRRSFFCPSCQVLYASSKTAKKKSLTV